MAHPAPPKSATGYLYKLLYGSAAPPVSKYYRSSSRAGRTGQEAQTMERSSACNSLYTS